MSLFKPNTGNEAEDQMSQAVDRIAIAALIVLAAIIGGVVAFVRSLA